MRLRIVAVGKLKETHWRAAAEEYLKRLRPYARVEVTEIPDRDVSADETRAIAAEGGDILRAVSETSHVIALDLGGRELSSEEFAHELEELGNTGKSDVTFIVGGAAGLDSAVLERANDRLAVSRMTLPHQLCRVVLLEQIYRAFRIMRNEPYHR